MPGDSVPSSPHQSVPGVALWSDSDGGGRPAGGPDFAGLLATPGDRAMPTIGHIGRYALKYQLGAGGLGTVFAAHDPLLSRLIAVKTLNVEIKESEREAFNALFINEARAAGGLSHPHIVTVFDAGISDNRAYIAMELLKGRDLRQLRQEGWRATPAQAALIVRRVADALAFAHSKGVIHRDIKPANIFMVGRTQPRVLDFGIARITHQRESGEAMNGAGSPYYMSPEQVRKEPGDRRTDVFSLGVVLYELLTDVKPFDGDSLKNITQAVLNHEPPLASKVDKTVPKALAEIAARAMAKDPDQRFRSARSFARDLRQWLDANPAGPEGEAMGATVPSAAIPVPRRKAPWIAAAALAIVAGVAGAALWSQDRPAAPTQAAVAPPPAAKPSPVAAESRPLAAPVAAVTAPAVAPPPATATPALAAPIAATPEPAARPPIPTGANNPAAQEALLLASIVPMPALSAARPPEPAKATPSVPEPAATARKPDTATAPPAAVLARRRRAGQGNRQGAPGPRSPEREARERELRTATPPVVVTGTVRLAVSPWGQVEVDGVASGAAPPLTELKLAEGSHQIVVRNGDFAPFVATINVVGGQTTSIRHKFGSGS